MPELPEVETVKRGVSPYLLGNKIARIEVRNGRLRYPVGEEIHALEGETVQTVSRRAKYLLIETDNYRLVVHLGMSGAISVFDSDFSPRKHDHLIIHLESGKALFYNDARRFGFARTYGIDEMPDYLNQLAPEPLSDAFNLAYFSGLLKDRKRAIKTVLMDQKMVVGVGNIYANESLFLSKINPHREARSLTKEEQETLLGNIKKVLEKAIEQGGTTLKDFSKPDGTPGYFAQELLVYGREGKPCPNCDAPIIRTVITQRSTFYCESCQRA